MDIRKALSIAGSDPSGGAGIQADLKTFTALEVYGAAAVTSVTVQNTQKVFDVLHLPGDFVREQIRAVLEDIDISHIKIGMLGNSDIARAVGETLEEWTQASGRKKFDIVCDPVMISKSGYPLIEEDAMRAVADFVVSLSTVLTPNAHELEKLSELIGTPPLTPIGSAEALLLRYDNLQAVLVKGGHICEDSAYSVDTLVTRYNDSFHNLSFSHPRLKTVNTHGTGCTLSSAITAYLARGLELSAAVEKAVDYVSRLIEISSQNKIGKGSGPLIHYLGK
jgi:hydroxymethylpyrimidine/phosphomethylpyrimidine kinase